VCTLGQMGHGLPLSVLFPSFAVCDVKVGWKVGSNGRIWVVKVHKQTHNVGGKHRQLKYKVVIFEMN
jgi:hypothetical protein